MARTWMLFDLDGTVLDYVAASRRALDATFAHLGLAATPELRAHFQAINADHWERYEQGVTTPARLRVHRWEDLLDALDHDHDDPDAVSAYYLQQLAGGGDLVDGARETLLTLARRHRLGAITNGFGDVQRPRLKAAGLDGVFEFLVVSEEAGASKPDAAIFDVAFGAMGWPDRSDVVFVGDSLSSDVAGGVAYGIHTVWFAPDGAEATGPYTPDRTIRSLAELLDDGVDSN